MRRAVTFSLVVLTVFLWAASLWRLSARVTGMDLVYAGIPAGLALLLLIGFAVSGRIFNPNDNVRRVFSAVLAVTLFVPRPLLKPNSDYEVLIVRYNPTYDAQPTDIPTFDSDAIITCLRNYKAENAFTTTPPSSSYTDILLEITVRQKVDQGDDWKTFWLGKTNYVYFGKFMYRIPDGNALQNELLQILDLPSAD